MSPFRCIFNTQQQKRGEGAFTERERERDLNVFNTHCCPHQASVRPPRTPICHSPRAYDAAIWKTEIIWREGRRQRGRAGPWVRSGDGERKREVEGLKKSAERSVWTHLEYYSILSCMFLNLWLRHSSDLHTVPQNDTQEEKGKSIKVSEDSAL